MWYFLSCYQKLFVTMQREVKRGFANSGKNIFLIEHGLNKVIIVEVFGRIREIRKIYFIIGSQCDD